MKALKLALWSYQRATKTPNNNTFSASVTAPDYPFFFRGNAY
jgi:hypothetical protein